MLTSLSITLYLYLCLYESISDCIYHISYSNLSLNTLWYLLYPKWISITEAIIFFTFALNFNIGNSILWQFHKKTQTKRNKRNKLIGQKYSWEQKVLINDLYIELVKKKKTKKNFCIHFENIENREKLCKSIDEMLFVNTQKWA